MKIIKLSFLLLFFQINQSYAQKIDFNFELGQQFAFGKKEIQDINIQKSNKHSLGQGVSALVGINIQPDSSNWGFGFGVQSLRGNNTIVFQSVNNSIAKVNTKSMNSFRFQTSLNYVFYLNKNKISINSGVVIPFLTKTIEEETYNTETEYYNLKYNLKHHFAVGYIGGFKIERKIQPRVSIFLNAQITLLSMKVKNKKATEYTNEIGADLMTAFPNYADRNISYHSDLLLIRNNKSILPQSFNTSKATDFLAYRDNLNAVGLNIGFVYHF